MEILIGILFYAITLTLMYMLVLKPRQQRLREEADAAAARAAEPADKTVIDKDFVAAVMEQRRDGFLDANTQHIAEVLTNWNPGAIVNAQPTAYKRLAVKVSALLNRERDVDQFERDLTDLLQKTFVDVPADVAGMAVYFTNWYTLQRGKL